MTLKIIGAAVGSGGPDSRTALGPNTVEQSIFLKESIKKGYVFEWIKTHTELIQSTSLETLCKLFTSLAEEVKNCVAEKERFCVIGGDHSAAIGTWSGAAAGWHQQVSKAPQRETFQQPQEPIGLIWIDAHEDAHTMETTPTGNIHGMPVAALLGYGDTKLTGIEGFPPKIYPENLCLVGIRSFEEEENELLKRLNIKIIDMPTVQVIGIESALQEAREWVTRYTKGYGITIDLDGLDPKDAPAVSTPVSQGIRAEAFLNALKTLQPDPRLIGFEIMEFNPSNDIEHKTEKLIIELLQIMERWS